MGVKQLSIITENSAAQLSHIFSCLSERKINIRAHCLVDNGDGYCKLRMIVSDPQEAFDILQDMKLAVVLNEVVIVEIDDKPGGLSKMLQVLTDDDIQIEYTYTAASEAEGIAVMVFRFSDNSRAAMLLEKTALSVEA